MKSLKNKLTNDFLFFFKMSDEGDGFIYELGLTQHSVIVSVAIQEDGEITEKQVHFSWFRKPILIKKLKKIIK